MGWLQFCTNWIMDKFEMNTNKLTDIDVNKLADDLEKASSITIKSFIKQIL